MINLDFTFNFVKKNNKITETEIINIKCLYHFTVKEYPAMYGLG